MPNLLTGHVSLVAGTWALETLVKHYFEQLFGEKKAEASAAGVKALRKEELLYDEAFAIVKCFMEVSTLHTVEDLQEFSNTRTPSSPWAHNVRVLVPMSCCDDAATLLIEALGGEEATRRVVGGTKWWQVRGLKGVEAQWILMKKDLQEAKRRQRAFDMSQRQQGKARATSTSTSMEGEEDVARESSESSDSASESVYEPRMDELRCILYFHGGGYYFGSIDQERYLMQRFARKTNSRLFAINYRLSPQYPFPCAIQDALAAYLFLIRPPPESLHRPVNPAHIIVSGDSAGGGLTLALLQVLRDSGTPMPAGAVLISPWCDLTHSFPSVHQNTKTDVMPRYGLSLHKPSTLWPPPPDEMTHHVRATLRHRIKEFVTSYSDNEDSEHSDAENAKPTHAKSHPHSPGRHHGHHGFFRRHFHRLHHRIHTRDEGYQSEDPPSKLRKFKHRKSGDVRENAMSESGDHIDLGASASAVLPASVSSTRDDLPSQDVSVKTENGEVLTIRDQIHFYTPNNLLMHPLVSPVVSYLGGLPPMLVIASDGEVLRDEIIYMTHKAAHPEKYPVVEAAIKMYPKLEGIEKRHKPTQVHLQVYDETAHVLPVLFSFCTPAKFCYRAMAAFVKYITGMPLTPSPSTQLSTGSEDATSGPSAMPPTQSILRRASARMTSPLKRRSVSVNELFLPGKTPVSEPEGEMLSVSEKGELVRRKSDGSGVGSSSAPSSQTSSPQVVSVGPDGVRFAGNVIVYTGTGEIVSPFTDNMIRERVSITGVIRPLEAEETLAGCQHPHERIGVIPELAVRRYIEGSELWRKKFKHTTRSVARNRKRNLDIAKKETVRNVDQLQMHFFQSATGMDEGAQDGDRESKEHPHFHALGSIRSRLSSRSRHAHDTIGIKEGLRKTAASWTWAWAIDGNERPPPSSIVARRDTEEARRLSKIADQPPDVNDHRLSGNNLWSILVNALSVEKAKQAMEHNASDGAATGITNASAASTSSTSADVSRFGELKEEVKDEVIASGRLSRLLSVRAKRHSLAPQLSAVKE